MWFYWAVFAVLFLATGLAVQYQNDSTQASEYATLDSLSRNLLVYRSAAAAYAQANPGFTGFPADAVLRLPDWFIKPAGVVAYLATGQSYTYFASTAPVGLSTALVERTQSLKARRSPRVSRRRPDRYSPPICCARGLGGRGQLSGAGLHIGKSNNVMRPDGLYFGLPVSPRWLLAVIQ